MQSNICIFAKESGRNLDSITIYLRYSRWDIFPSLTLSSIKWIAYISTHRQTLAWAGIYIYIFEETRCSFRLFKGFGRNLSQKVFCFIGKRSREGGLLTNAWDWMRSDTLSNRRSPNKYKKKNKMHIFKHD